MHTELFRLVILASNVLCHALNSNMPAVALSVVVCMFLSGIPIFNNRSLPS